MAADQQPSPKRLTISTFYIGVDLHRTVLQIRILDATGEAVSEQRCIYESLEKGLHVVKLLVGRAPGARLTVEAPGLNRWFVNTCLNAGFDLLVCDPRKLGLKKLGKKTDRRDPAELARRLSLGDLDRMARAYCPSDEKNVGRELLCVHHRFVQLRQQATDQIRGLLNAYQISAPRGVLHTRPGRDRLTRVSMSGGELQQAFDASGAVQGSVQTRLQALTRKVKRLPREEPELALLDAALPSIGAPSAATLLTELGGGRPCSDQTRQVRSQRNPKWWLQACSETRGRSARRDSELASPSTRFASKWTDCTGASVGRPPPAKLVYVR